MEFGFRKTETIQNIKVSRHHSCSFEQYFMKNKCERQGFRGKTMKKKTLKFIDDINPQKSFEDIVNVESFKQYNVNITDDEVENKCTCIII